MTKPTVQSFIVSGPILSFECDIDLAGPNAEMQIDELAGDMRRVVKRMRARAAQLATSAPSQGTE